MSFDEERIAAGAVALGGMLGVSRLDGPELPRHRLGQRPVVAAWRCWNGRRARALVADYEARRASPARTNSGAGTAPEAIPAGPSSAATRSTPRRDAPPRALRRRLLVGRAAPHGRHVGRRSERRLAGSSPSADASLIALYIDQGTRVPPLAAREAALQRGPGRQGGGRRRLRADVCAARTARRRCAVAASRRRATANTRSYAACRACTTGTTGSAERPVRVRLGLGGDRIPLPSRSRPRATEGGWRVDPQPRVHFRARRRRASGAKRCPSGRGRRGRAQP